MSEVSPAGAPTNISVRSVRVYGASSDEYVTPRWILDAVSPFDLDPCAAPRMPWRTAARMILPPDDGLLAEWSGIVWLNPPYSKTGRWADRLSEHGLGVALVPASVETAWFDQFVWTWASGVLFPRGGINFCTIDGEATRRNMGRGSALVAYGEIFNKLLKVPGTFVRGWRR